MKRSAYLETTIIGYLAMRNSRDVRVAANQLSTREWWDDHRPDFDIFVSQFVLDECDQGDPTAADERRIYLKNIPVLDMNQAVEQLADAISMELQIPPKARIDAFHISMAAVHGVQFLLTWNCKHIANPEHRPRIERACRDRGIEPPLICTPFDMLEI
ncbi:MAG: type II toxin-antitoxin system VapC family toxin [Pirellulaceae bacterium]|nr:type II toxin-antitoxin system VapC family toxin [Planctomycetales bacterium]